MTKMVEIVPILLICVFFLGFSLNLPLNSDIVEPFSDFNLSLSHNHTPPPSGVVSDSSVSKKVEDYILHNSILISGDTDFHLQAEREGWDFGGLNSGNLTHPYIISGYQFSNSSGRSVDIRNTLVHFYLIDNVLNAQSSSFDALYLDNVSNAVITRNSISFAVNGIFGNDVSSSYITYNHIFNHSEMGITVYSDKGNVVITNNLLFNNDQRGLRASGDYFTISYNQIFNNRWTGVSVAGNYHILSDNQIYDNWWGIRIGMYGENHTIQNNDIFANIYGLDIGYTRFILIINNTFRDHFERGISLTHSMHISFLNNTFIHSKISNHVSENISISNNFLNHSTIEFYQVNFSYIQENVIFDSNIGISITRAHDNLISNNTLLTNTLKGVYFHDQTENNLVIWNDFLLNIKESVIDNYPQAYDFTAKNSFDSNYWDEWTGPDQNADGFVDDPYIIQSSSSEYSTDLYPLTLPNNPKSSHFHYLSRPRITRPSSSDTFSDIIVIEWLPAHDSWNHPVTYSLFLLTQNRLPWVQLAVNLTDTTFIWDTQEHNYEECKLKLETSCLEGVISNSYSLNTFEIVNIPDVEEATSFWFDPLSILLGFLFIIILFRKLNRN